ncbi:hypothetical protein K1T71_002331 [Dendrolimus kikuchii]|uniref:Uncharacterized protein n=1 Tax=Dendrolimus kikuchii TaxID=765133 RepID=A0ACC1DCB7_9NEOP|nr:hypothetical protein K1T71_002331 [Dendrolimus kikuchii]
MDELKVLILDMKKDMDQKFSTIESRLLYTEGTITESIKLYINEKFQGLNEELTDFKIQIEDQERRLYKLEKNNVERNLVFFGVNENERNYFDLQNIILNIINDKIKVAVLEQDIQAIRRLGRRTGQARPISVAFTTLATKIKILKNKNNLKDLGIYIKQEYPLAILEKRKELNKQKQEQIKMGNTAYIRYDKIIIKEKQGENSKKKKELSQSPIQPPTSENQNEKKAPNSTGQNMHKKFKTSKSNAFNFRQYVTQSTEK